LEKKRKESELGCWRCVRIGRKASNQNTEQQREQERRRWKPGGVLAAC
jgi:hypothetical protein